MNHRLQTMIDVEGCCRDARFIAKVLEGRESEGLSVKGNAVGLMLNGFTRICNLPGYAM